MASSRVLAALTLVVGSWSASGPIGAPARASSRWGVDGSLGGGAALGPPDSGAWGDGRAGARVGVGVGVTRHVDADGPWVLGGAASATLEWWDGGVGCGTLPPGEVVPAVGLVCALPTVGLHALAGAERAIAARARLRATVGAGATAFFLSAAGGDSIARSLAPSAVIELQAIGRVDRTLWLGVAVEGRVLADEGRRGSAGAALVIAWR
jgi:hypothetical protein